MPHRQLATHCCRCLPFFWLLEGAGAKISKVLVLVYVFAAIVSIFLALIFGRALLFHYCTHEGTLSCGHTGALLNFGDKLTLEDLPIQRKHAKGFFSSNVPFFAEGRPDGVRKYGKMRQSPKNGNIRPAWARRNQKDFKKKTYLFSRPSVHPSKLFPQLSPQDQGEWMCSDPVYIPHKCRNVQMFAPAAHCKKQAKVLYFDTNCGAKVVQPRNFSYVPGSE